MCYIRYLAHGCVHSYPWRPGLHMEMASQMNISRQSTKQVAWWGWATLLPLKQTTKHFAEPNRVLTLYCSLEKRPLRISIGSMQMIKLERTQRNIGPTRSWYIFTFFNCAFNAKMSASIAILRGMKKTKRERSGTKRGRGKNIVLNMKYCKDNQLHHQNQSFSQKFLCQYRFHILLQKISCLKVK